MLIIYLVSECGVGFIYVSGVGISLWEDQCVCCIGDIIMLFLDEWIVLFKKNNMVIDKDDQVDMNIGFILGINLNLKVGNSNLNMNVQMDNSCQFVGDVGFD